MNICELYAKSNPVIEGSEKGKCSFCGQLTVGHKPNFPKTFIGYQDLCFGNILCNSCYSCYKNESLRKRSWLITEQELRYLSRVDIPAILQNPPKNTFWALYVTETNKKLGWLRGRNQVNAPNSNSFSIIHEDYIINQVSIEQFIFVFTRIQKLIDLRIPKRVLKSLDISPSLYSRIWKMKEYSEINQFLQDLDKYKNGMLISLCVFLAKCPELSTNQLEE